MQIMNEINSMIASLNSIKARIDADPSVANTVSQAIESNDSFAAFFESELNSEPDVDVPVLEAASASISETYLTDSLAHSRMFKPSVKELMDATGLEFNDAGAMIGVGAAGYADYRDWEKVMSSSDPASALQQANNQLFNSTDVDWAPYRTKAHHLDADKVVARTDNFAVVELNKGEFALQLVDGRGRHLSQAGATADQIKKHASYFGQDIKQLSSILPQLEALSPRLAYAVETALV